LLPVVPDRWRRRAYNTGAIGIAFDLAALLGVVSDGGADPENQRSSDVSDELHS
jgi:hypothetical protein